jgi:predicted phage gp36 major capsid-like protein
VVDRLGMNVEVVQHLFDTSTGYPTGQRGLYAFWRNTSLVLADEALRKQTA